MSHYQRWAARRAPTKKEPQVYRCPHCDFGGDLDKVWWHIGQHQPRLAAQSERAEA